jgi:hypothetical protein
MSPVYSRRMTKVERTLEQDWLATYVRNYVLDTLAPAERMQFRMACGRGVDAVAGWAEATLPKYTSVWRRLKSAERQRRYRSVPSMQKWMTDWHAAERTLGHDLTALLRRHRGELGVAPSATPAEVLSTALHVLEKQLDARAPTLTTVFVEGPAHPPLAADRDTTNWPDNDVTEIR